MRRLNKKGAIIEESGAKVVIALVFLVIVLLIIWQGYNYYLHLKQKATPSSFQETVAFCTSRATEVFKVDYCQKFELTELLNGEVMYVNCIYPAVKNALGDNAKPNLCEIFNQEKDILDFCISKMKEDEEDVIVNGNDCDVLVAGTCTGQGGEWFEGEDCPETDETYTYSLIQVTKDYGKPVVETDEDGNPTVVYVCCKREAVTN